MKTRAAAILAALWLAAPVGAVQPDEILPDAAMETRARDISAGLRCPVCRNETIDESNAALARDLRLLVRERLMAGDSDAEVVEFIVSRYGEFVLLTPAPNGSNLVLWIAGPAMLLAALGIGWATVRRPRAAPQALDADEKARLARLLED